MLEEILAYNKQFVENKGYESYITNKYSHVFKMKTKTNKI